MLVKSEYQSPLGQLLILCDEKTVKGVWFKKQKYFGAQYDLASIPAGENETTTQVKGWLTQYFAREIPEIHFALLAPETTGFRQKVFEILKRVPAGQTITYKEIADKLREQESGVKGSARAVGGAVGHNPISLLIPCHRVVGSDGSLTGYAGGIERKKALLALEGFDRGRLEKGYI